MTATRCKLFLAVSMGLWLAACVGEDGRAGPMGEPGAMGACLVTEILLAGPGLYPEGIAVAADGSLYVGSVVTGEIARLAPCEGLPTPFADVGDLSAIGMTSDEENGALWVCATDRSGASGPAIIGFSLEDGSEMARHRFPDDAGFCNDVVLDSRGNLYATDSLGACIVRVEAAELLTAEDAVDWLTDERFVVGPGQIGLNGIAVDSADTLYVPNSVTNELYRVDISDSGEPIGLITLDVTPALGRPDGVEVLDDSTLLVVESTADQVSLVSLDGDDGMGSVIANRLDAPTTAAIDGQSAWVVEGQIEDLVGETQPDLPFRITRIVLP